MQAKTRTLIKLIDDALQVAEERLLRRETGVFDPAPLSGLEAVVASLKERKEMALKGTLKPLDGRNSVGLNRELLEWGEWGTPLFQAIQSVEEFYWNNFGQG